MPPPTCSTLHHKAEEESTDEMSEDEDADDNTDDDDSSSQTSKATTTTASESHNKNGAHCNCCYCEVFGPGGQTVAPVSRNYPEMRERLRLLLSKKKRKSQQQHPPPPPPVTSHSFLFRRKFEQASEASLQELDEFTKKTIPMCTEPLFHFSPRNRVCQGHKELHPRPRLHLQI